MDRSGLTRGTRWCQACSPNFCSLEVIHEKNITQKTIFLFLVTSRTYSIRLTANLRAQIDGGDPGLSFGCLTILLASSVIEIIAIFCENSPILRKFDLFWPPVTSHLTWSKNDLSIFCRSCHGLSNAVYRLSVTFLVFEFSGGGGAVIRRPGRAKVAQTPGRARVNEGSKATGAVWHLPCPRTLPQCSKPTSV